jgi:hypothetical protein
VVFGDYLPDDAGRGGSFSCDWDTGAYFCRNVVGMLAQLLAAARKALDLACWPAVVFGHDVRPLLFV